MTTAIAIRPTEKAIADLQAISEECSIAHVTQQTQWLQTFRLAEGMRRMRDALTGDVMADIMTLQNTPLGFDTDQNPAKSDKARPYGEDIVRDAVIEAVMRGYRPIGNEFNIISRRFYATQAGLFRKVQEWPGLTGLTLSPGVPENKSGGALVPYVATWEIGGEEHGLTCLDMRKDGQGIDERIPVRVNAGMGSDAILGKAKRKVLARIVERLTGVVEPEGDVSDADTMPRVESKRATVSDANERPELFE